MEKTDKELAEELRKWRCNECDEIIYEKDLLTTNNPFDESQIISGCPICYSVECFTEICDEPDCKQEAICGFPTTKGYRRTCSKHMYMYENS